MNIVFLCFPSLTLRHCSIVEVHGRSMVTDLLVVYATTCIFTRIFFSANPCLLLAPESIDKNDEYPDNIFSVNSYELDLRRIYGYQSIFMARLTIVRGPYRFCPVRACIFCFHRKWYLWVSKRLLV